jgi:hypothetical protein
MVLQMLARSITWESESVAVVANGASAPVLGHMIVRRIALGAVAGNFGRRCPDLVFEIRAHLNGSGDVGCRMFLIHACQHGCHCVEELVWVRLFYGLGSAGRNRLGDFLRWRSEEPSGDGDEASSDEPNKNGSKPHPGSIRFHIFRVEFGVIIGAGFF